MAQAFVLQDARGRRTLWLSVDLIGFTNEFSTALRYDLSAMTNVPYEAVLVSQAHPHSGPMTNFDKYPSLLPKPPDLAAYEQNLRRELVRLACTAVDRLGPARVRLCKGHSDVGINRRNRNQLGETVMAPDPDGCYNRDLWVLDVQAQDSGRCVLFSYGCHPVIAYGFVWDGISADYPGVCRRRLKENLGATVHCQFIQGLAGNVRPRVLGDPESGHFRKATPDDLEQAGTQLADDVLDALASQGELLVPEIRAVSGWFLAQRDIERVPPLEHWQEVAHREDELSRNLGQYWVQRLQTGLPPVRAVPWQVGLLRLTDDHCIAWLAGEAVAEWQGHLRHWLQNDQLVVWGYCQSMPAYLPTDELLPQGGYEVVQSNLYGIVGPGPFASGLNDAVRQRFLALAEQV
jgi:hypothetical protein